MRQGCEKLEHGGLLREACQLLRMCPSSLFHHSDVALGVSVAGLKGSGEEQSSRLHASLCLNASCGAIEEESEAAQGLAAFEDLAAWGA